MNTFGHIFRITTFGESHGEGIGVVIDGCPAGLEIDLAFLASEMKRRKPGQSKITTPRKEKDEIKILSGTFEGKSTGTPLAIFIPNQDQNSGDYSHIATKFRPSHADYTYEKKYGNRDYRGGGRSSARETAARVAAGAIAKLFLQSKGISIQGYVSQVGNITLQKEYSELDFSKKENIMRCPNEETATKMIEFIEKVKNEGDTIGGVVSCVIKTVPVGLGEPVFDKLHAELGKAMLSINAVKGFEYGSGFEGVKLKGSEHNDEFYKDENGKIRTKTNHSGGIQGGISNGEDIYFKVAFKPVATLMKDQESVDNEGNKTTVSGKGRHDPCVVPRAVPIVEAMAALVITDFYLRQKSHERINS
ncbi:chorismate synthase [Bernardetia litoralis DSM 6794]|uniref:Chorismate synthase n=1 Tax=Bernardetia litoralis (strain ATCC 23117 / DSM 6794 / NBRC 15988 / NCIMB 1366 / Fx l1 / Sio-4) TaxID=880071 RepID=I4AQ49_BERLS|nr:chorismate synthase [Bernardetia litoralis]AFM06084.1 chorismate synthase [Bernardetia litoralis DSM 6794]